MALGYLGHGPPTAGGARSEEPATRETPQLTHNLRARQTQHLPQLLLMLNFLTMQLEAINMERAQSGHNYTLLVSKELFIQYGGLIVLNIVKEFIF